VFRRRRSGKESGRIARIISKTDRSLAVDCSICANFSLQLWARKFRLSFGAHCVKVRPQLLALSLRALSLRLTSFVSHAKLTRGQGQSADHWPERVTRRSQSLDSHQVKLDRLLSWPVRLSNGRVK